MIPWVKSYEKGAFMDNILKLILMGAGLIFTCLVVGLGFHLSRESSVISASSSQQLTEFAKELSERNLLQYDNLLVKGSDVINLMKRELNNYGEDEEAPIYVKVETKTGVNQYNNGKVIESCREFTDGRYIKPIAIFLGSVVKNQNDVIIGVHFIQQ